MNITYKQVWWALGIRERRVVRYWKICNATRRTMYRAENAQRMEARASFFYQGYKS